MYRRFSGVRWRGGEVTTRLILPPRFVPRAVLAGFPRPRASRPLATHDGVVAPSLQCCRSSRLVSSLVVVCPTIHARPVRFASARPPAPRQLSVTLWVKTVHHSSVNILFWSGACVYARSLFRLFLSGPFPATRTARATTRPAPSTSADLRLIHINWDRPYRIDGEILTPDIKWRKFIYQSRVFVVFFQRNTNKVIIAKIGCKCIVY